MWTKMSAFIRDGAWEKSRWHASLCDAEVDSFSLCYLWEVLPHTGAGLRTNPSPLMWLEYGLLDRLYSSEEKHIAINGFPETHKLYTPTCLNMPNYNCASWQASYSFPVLAHRGTSKLDFSAFNPKHIICGWILTHTNVVLHHRQTRRCLGSFLVGWN